MTTRPLTPREFATELAGFTRAKFRLEQQDTYNEPDEAEPFRRWLAGEVTDPTDDDPGFAEALERIKRDTVAGKTWRRVRIQDDPPTPYQAWERWCGLWQARAGEDIRYLTRQQAHEIGLLPDAGPDDWWLLDDDRLVVLRYNEDAALVGRELTTDPGAVTQARAWRDLAVQHAIVPDEARGAA